MPQFKKANRVLSLFLSLTSSLPSLSSLLFPPFHHPTFLRIGKILKNFNPWRINNSLQAVPLPFYIRVTAQVTWPLKVSLSSLYIKCNDVWVTNLWILKRITHVQNSICRMLESYNSQDLRLQKNRNTTQTCLFKQKNSLSHNKVQGWLLPSDLAGSRGSTVWSGHFSLSW